MTDADKKADEALLALPLASWGIVLEWQEDGVDCVDWARHGHDNPDSSWASRRVSFDTEAAADEFIGMCGQGPIPVQMKPRRISDPLQPGEWIVDTSKLPAGRGASILTPDHPAVTVVGPYYHCEQCSRPGMSVRHPVGAPHVVHLPAPTQEPSDSANIMLRRSVVELEKLCNTYSDIPSASVRHFVNAMRAELDQAPTQEPVPDDRYAKLVAELRFVCSAAGDIEVQDVLPGYLNRLDPEILEGVSLSHQPPARALVYAALAEPAPTQEPVPETPIERRSVAREAQDVVNAARKVAALRLVGTQDARLERELDDALAAFDALRAERETK